MKRDKMVLGLIICLIVISSLLAITDKAIRAEGATSDLGMSKKLDDILNNQKAILEGLESIKKELYVIKIRITTR